LAKFGYSRGGGWWHNSSPGQLAANSVVPGKWYFAANFRAVQGEGTAGVSGVPGRCYGELQPKPPDGDIFKFSVWVKYFRKRKDSGHAPYPTGILLTKRYSVIQITKTLYCITSFFFLLADVGFIYPAWDYPDVDIYSECGLALAAGGDVSD
jgi:hypothetical protein